MSDSRFISVKNETENHVDVTDKRTKVNADKKEIIKPIPLSIQNIITIYVSNYSTLAPKTRTLVLESIIVSHGLPLLPTDNLSIDIGKINEADCVIMFYSQDRKNTPAKLNGCERLLDDCLFKKTSCKSVIEFELKYAITQKKNVIVFIDEEAKVDAAFLNIFSNHKDLIKTVFYSEIEGDLISRNFSNFKKSHHLSKMGFFRRKDYCLNVLNQCIQRGSVPQKTIGEYTNTSGEMTAASNSEIHILTNEWINYDYTTMSSLTIAINTKKGVKYCYYAPEKYRPIVEKFREVLKGYYKKTFKAREKVVAWIRMSKCENYYLDDFIFNVTNKEVKDVISSLLTTCGDDYYSIERVKSVLESCKDGNTPISLKVDRNKLNSWIHGEPINNTRTIMRFLRNLGIILKALKGDEYLYKNAVIYGFCSKLELLYNMYLLHQWQTGRDEENPLLFSEEETSELITYFKYKDSSAQKLQGNLIISDPVEEWLRPTCGEDMVGEIPENEDNDVDKYLQNILFLPIDEEVTPTLAYNFTLFLGYSPNGGTYNESAAWYTTFSDNSSTDTERIDNDLFMVDIGPNDHLFSEIKEIFKKIIVSNETIRRTLEETNSIILQILENK